MSIRTETVLKCDKCGAAGPGTILGKPESRTLKAAAKKEGWKTGLAKDFCPACSAQISEAIKLAQAGEIK